MTGSGTESERPPQPADGLAAAFEPLWHEASVVIARGGYFPCTPDWSLPEQVRPHYQVWLVERGTATLVVETRSFARGAGAARVVPPTCRGADGTIRPTRCTATSSRLPSASSAPPPRRL